MGRGRENRGESKINRQSGVQDRETKKRRGEMIPTLVMSASDRRCGVSGAVCVWGGGAVGPLTATSLMEPDRQYVQRMRKEGEITQCEEFRVKYTEETEEDKGVEEKVRGGEMRRERHAEGDNAIR